MALPIPPIKPVSLAPIPGSDPGQTPTSGGQTPLGDPFGQALSGALEKLDAGQQSASRASLDLATGKATDVSAVVTQVEKASLELQLATQVRNKLVDAYSELMRMQI